MAPRGHLTSQRRQDYTGKIVTRWVRDSPESVDTASIPAPIVLTTVLDEAKDREELSNELHDIIVLTGYGAEQNSIWYCINQMDTATIRCLIEYNESENDSSENIGKWAMTYYRDNVRVRELATYASAFDPATDVEFIEIVIDQIHLYPEIPRMEDYSQAPPVLKEVIKGLLSLTDTLYSEDYDMNPESAKTTIEDSPLRMLIFAYPDKSDQIAHLISERHTTDVEMIREVILSPSPALSEGVL